ncbi:MAG: lactonase family protein [Brachybacterium sp.]|uniref:lactonase family protein n=1 Tax=unclassified Brachybacterium TaxID=2623841 RepID=UPI003FB8B291
MSTTALSTTAVSATAQIAVGGYSRSGTGRGPGLTLLKLTLEDPHAVPAVEQLAVVDLADPSFVLWNEDGTLLYAVLEGDPTRVAAVRVSADGCAAEVLGELAVDGSGGCHLSFGTDRSTLVIAQYGAGSVVTVRLDADGVPLEQIDLDDHHDYSDGEDPHPHQVVPLPGTEVLAVPDLGLDRVLLYRQDVEGMINLSGEIPLRRGSGPRHLAPDHESEQLYIACELSGMVATASRDEPAPQLTRGAAGRDPRAGHRWSVRSMTPASSHEGPNALSHIELAAEESLLVVANRGPDTLSLLSLAMMRPQLVAEIEVGAHPRHFTQWGELILVAAQEGDCIDVLRRAGERLEVVGEPIPVPSAACLAVRP